jgi:uncharacterized protein
MAPRVNLRQLEQHNVRLEGELAAPELDLEGVDELIRLEEPLRFALEAQALDQGVLVQGSLGVNLACECARCLRPFSHRLELNPWTCLLPLEGEDRAVVVNDYLDLTPYIREDIILEFPQHPLCKPECGGLPKNTVVKTQKTGGTGQTKENSSAWAALNKLTF